MALTRRDLLKSGVAVAATSSVSPLFLPRVAGAQGKRGGILRVRGYDPPHFDPHQTLNFKTNNTLSFVHAKLVRHKVGAGVTPGSFVVEPDLAERWEEPTTGPWSSTCAKACAGRTSRPSTDAS